MDEDVIFRYDHAMPGEEDKNLFIGLDRSGNPLEIFYALVNL
jgi:hypothetical protein